MKKYIIELIGTFFLVLVVCFTANPLAIGAVLMAMVYMGGPISGGHYNPAVSLGVFMRGKLSGKDFGMYFIFQLIGALLASLIYYLISNRSFAPVPGLEVSFVKATVMELFFTCALVLVVLSTATTKKAAGNSYFGLAIGFTLFVGAQASGPISGGALNPAVAVGTEIMDLITGGSLIKYIPIYLIGPFLGGALAAWLFRATNPDECEAAAS